MPYDVITYDILTNYVVMTYDMTLDFITYDVMTLYSVMTYDVMIYDMGRLGQSDILFC